MENREIKFRGKDKQSGKWVYGDLIQGNKTYIVINIDKFIEVYPETVGQYTCLKDNNVVEIYEGDICIFNFGNILKSKRQVELNKDFFDNYYHSNGTEVIGNIIDNPELLTNKN